MIRARCSFLICFILINIYCSTISCQATNKYFLVGDKYLPISKSVHDSIRAIYPERKAEYTEGNKDTVDIKEISYGESGDWSIIYYYKMYHGEIYDFVYIIAFFNADSGDELTKIKNHLRLNVDKIYTLSTNIDSKPGCSIIRNYPIELDQQLNVQNKVYKIVKVEE